MYSAMPDRCSFSCGDAGVNRLWLNALWGQRSNFLEIPTDCPQRDERLGWTGDAQIFAPAAMLNMDCLAFFRKYLRDIRDGFTPEGAAPSIAPAVLHINDGAAGWGDAVTLLPCALYRHYGSTAVLAENYEAMSALCIISFPARRISSSAAKGSSATGSRRRRLRLSWWRPPISPIVRKTSPRRPEFCRFPATAIIS